MGSDTHLVAICKCCICKAKRGENKGENSPGWKGERAVKRRIYKCIVCQKTISTNTFLYGTKKCRFHANLSRELGWKRPDAKERLTGTNHWNWKGGKSLKQYCCKDCGKNISYTTMFYGNGRCKSCSKSSTRNPSWIDGRSFEDYPIAWSNALKERIRKRDEYRCQICGRRERDLVGFMKKLSVHHIDYNKRNLYVENLVTVCLNCHQKTNFDRDKWKEFFHKLFIERGIING